MKNKIFLLLIVAFSFGACKKEKGATPEPPVQPPSTTKPYTPDNSFKIVAYFPSYRNPDSVDVSKYKMITHLYYAFLNPDVDGNLLSLAEPVRFTKVINLARTNGVKVGISVSGPDATFVNMAAKPAARTRLVKNLLAFVKQHNLDGVDMDWEYPRSGSSDVNYHLLIKELSDTLHNNQKYLSAAVTPAVYAGAVRDGIKAETFPYVDFFNIMMYDGLGWDKSLPIQHSSYDMTVASADVWLIQKGLPKEKAVFGMASYGRNSKNAAIGYRELVNMGRADAQLDSVTYKGDLYFYNGINTIRKKSALAKQRGNGLMLWEFYFDTNGPTSLLKAMNDEIGRNY